MQHQTKAWADPRRWPADLWRESMLILGREAGRDKYSIGDIQSRRKGSRLTACRRRLAWELHQNHGLSTPQIGALMRKDHSTVVRLLRNDGAQNEEPIVQGFSENRLAVQWRRDVARNR